MCKSLNDHIHKTRITLVDQATQSNVRLIRNEQPFLELLQVWNFGIFRSKIKQIGVTQPKVRFLFLLVDITNQLELIIVHIIATVDTINCAVVQINRQWMVSTLQVMMKMFLFVASFYFGL